jgi:hypothetical protein
VHRNNYSNIYPKRCNFTQFILSGNCSTCFEWYLHPKHLEQFPDKLCKVASPWIYIKIVSFKIFEFSHRVFLKRWGSVVLDSELQRVCSDFLHKFSNQPYITKCKEKAIPLQAWTGLEISSRLRLQYCKTIGT